MELMDQTGSCSIRVIDLDDGSVRAISWDPNVPDQVFESLVESQLRAQFGVSDEAWVDLIDTANSSLVHITKDVLSNVKDSLCLCLSPKTEALAPMKTSEVFEVVFQDRALGMTIREHNESVIVNHFKRKPDGALGEAEARGSSSPTTSSTRSTARAPSAAATTTWCRCCRRRPGRSASSSSARSAARGSSPSSSAAPAST